MNSPSYSGHHLYVDNILEFNGAVLTSMAHRKLREQNTKQTKKRSKHKKKVVSSPSKTAGAGNPDLIDEELLNLEVEEFVEV